MHSSTNKHGEFYGITTLGERGQIVVPAKARENFGLKKGDQLFVFGMGKNMVALIKLEQMKEFTEHLTEKLESFKTILKNNHFK